MWNTTRSGLAVAVEVGDRDAGALVLGAEPARNRLDVAPAAGDVAVGVQVPADAIVAVVLSTGVVDVEHHQVGPAVAVDVRKGEAGALIFGAEPAGTGLTLLQPPVGLPLAFRFQPMR